MPNVLFYVAPLAILLPAPAVQDDVPVHLLPEKSGAEEAVRGAEPALGWQIIESMAATPLQNQVRIEQRVTIRISPIRPSPRQSLMPDAPRIDLRDMDERDAGRCVPLRSIRAVQSTSDNRLLLYLRDQRVMSVRMKKTCRAQDFYSGFYVEPRADGMLCVDRDILRSRTGANCEMKEINWLVADD